MDLPLNNVQEAEVCLTCRNRRVRCDHEEPRCGPCRKACVPCKYSHGSQVQKRGRPRGTRMSGRKLDNMGGNTTSIESVSLSMQKRAGKNSKLEFVNIYRPLEAGKAENRAVVRSHVMRNYKLWQRAEYNPPSSDRFVSIQPKLRSTKRSYTCTCVNSLCDVALSDATIALDYWSYGLREARNSFPGHKVIPQLLSSNKTTFSAKSIISTLCDICGGQLSFGIKGQFECDEFENYRPYLSSDVFDPSDTFQSSTSRLKIKELVYHAISTLWPSLLPLGTIDPIEKALRLLFTSDELLVQVNLFNAAFHLAALQGEKHSVEGTWRRIETIRILNRRLRDPQRAITDATITAVTNFVGQAIVSRSISEIKIHTDGLQKMVGLAGGLENLGLDGLLQEIVYWTDLAASAVTASLPHFPHPLRPQRLAILPIFTAPRCPMSKMGSGFSTVFSSKTPYFTTHFQALLELVNQVRCLAWVLHISSSCGRPRITLVSFRQRGEWVRSKVRELTNVFAELWEEKGERRGYEHLFECLRFTTLIFLEFVLDRGTCASHSSSTSDMFTSLSSNLLKAVQKLDAREMQASYAGFFFWVFSMGAIGAAAAEVGKNESFVTATARTRRSKKTYFVDLMNRLVAAKHVQVRNWSEAKALWIGFLATEIVLDGPLRMLWTETQEGTSISSLAEFNSF